MKFPDSMGDRRGLNPWEPTKQKESVLTIRSFLCDNGHTFDDTQSWIKSKWDCPVCGNSEHWNEIVRRMEREKEEEMLLCKPDNRFSLDVAEAAV